MKFPERVSHYPGGSSSDREHGKEIRCRAEGMAISAGAARSKWTKSSRLAAQRIPIEGRYRQEGEGNSAATVGAVLAAGVIGGLIVTGKTARIPEGREFTVHTVDAIPATAGTGNGVPALIAVSYAPSAVNLQVMTDKERKALEKATKAAQRKAERKRA